MRHYTDLSELIDEVNSKEYISSDISDRKLLVHAPIREKMLDDMQKKDSSYRFHYLTMFPFVGKTLMNRRINKYLRWIDSIFTDDYRLKYQKEVEEELKMHRRELLDAFSLLDEESKKIFLDLICLRLFGDFRYITQVYNSGEQYFSNKIVWKEHPNIVDGGGYIGDTLLAFINKGIVPKDYYIYELEDSNYKLLLRNVRIASKKGINVHVRKKGIYSKNGELYFISDKDSSKIVDYKTDDSIEVVTIDSDVKEIPDFIKMDIEGSEVDALAGAAGVIRSYSPTLAICIYHKKDDFWKIPLLINKINPHYNKYWIEHYQLGYNETVLFVSK